MAKRKNNLSKWDSKWARERAENMRLLKCANYSDERIAAAWGCQPEEVPLIVAEWGIYKKPKEE